MRRHKAAQRRAVSIPNHGRLDGVRVPVLDARNSHLASGSTSDLGLLAFVLVLLPTARVGFVRLGWPGHQTAARRKGLTEPVGQMPRRFLCDAKLSV